MVLFVAFVHNGVLKINFVHAYFLFCTVLRNPKTGVTLETAPVQHTATVLEFCYDRRQFFSPIYFVENKK